MKTKDFNDKFSLISTCGKAMLASGMDQIVFDGKDSYIYNGEVFCRTSNLIGFDGTVNLKLFLGFLEKLKDDEINFELQNGNLKIKFNSGRSVANFTFSENPENPVDLPSFNWNKLPEDLPNKIAMAAELCQTGSDKQKTKFIHLKGGIVESTDEERIIRIRLKEKMDCELLIPKEIAIVLPKINPVEYALNQSWIAFRDENKSVIAQRTVEAEYYNLDEILEKCRNGRKIYFPQETASCIDKANVFLNDMYDYDKRIQFKCRGRKLKISSTGQFGAYSEIIPFKEDVTFSFAIIYSFLQKILNFKYDDVYLGNDFIRIEGENFTFISTLQGE